MSRTNSAAWLVGEARSLGGGLAVAVSATATRAKGPGGPMILTIGSCGMIRLGDFEGLKRNSNHKADAE
jgi:hypothetical protein